MTDRALRARIALGEIEAMGLTVDDLITAAGRPTASRSACPSVADYVEVVAAGYEPRTRRTYNSYWRLLVELHGEADLDSVTVEDLMEVAEEAARRAKERRAGSDGRASKESCVAAMRAVFARAHRSGLVRANLALQVDKPRRLPNRRRALSQAEVDDVWEAVSATTKDPELDLLLVRFHLESGARRMGAINLRLRDIDETRQTVWLREKFGAEREQPVSRSLLVAVLAHAACRGTAQMDDPVFRLARRRQGEPLRLSDRTYDRIFAKAQERIPWAQRTPLTAHVLRHTAITAVERLAGYAVAQAFAGHTPSSVTGTYTKAGIAEIAAAVAMLSAEPHPLAQP
jgi:integrase/recombinase XerC